MTDIGSTFQPRFIRCSFCSRIYDVAASQHCPECRRLQTPDTIDEKPQAPATRSAAVGRAASRLSWRWTLASAMVVLPMAIFATWLAFFGGRGPRPSPRPEEIIIDSPPHREERKTGIEARRLNLKASEVFKECDICPEMVVVPGGSFVMGSPQTEYGSSGDERPQHEVTISGNFGAGKFEVTVRQFLEFLNASANEARFFDSWIASAPENSGAPVVRSTEGSVLRFFARAEDEEHPITFVSWNGAVAYASWISRRANTPYRLLSEAEWEYAARADSKTAYYFGDD